jgi:hypothetical protein
MSGGKRFFPLPLTLSLQGRENERFFASLRMTNDEGLTMTRREGLRFFDRIQSIRTILHKDASYVVGWKEVEVG